MNNKQINNEIKELENTLSKLQQRQIERIKQRLIERDTRNFKL